MSATSARHIASASVAGSPRRSIGYRTVMVFWVVILFDVHFFLGAMVASVFARLMSLALVALLAVIAFDLPRIIEREPRWVWFAPFAILILASIISMPRATNQILARNIVQYFVIYYLLAVSSAIYIKSPRLVTPLLILFGARFAWWALWGGAKGLVPWHPTMANYDGFGGLMVMGVGICFWFALATRVKWQRRVLFALAAYCILGVVASMARGAFLALVAVVGFIWIRSPRKGVTTLAIFAALALVVVTSSILFDGNFFWDEIRSVFEEGTDEGTGAHRWAMWGAAIEVWRENPMFGVGPGNFGVFASTYFEPGEIEGFNNPNAFWGFNLHNAYVQILSELGIVGFIAFASILVDFVLKNRALQQPAASAAWERLAGPGAPQLRYLACGLEAGLVGVFLSNMVYASLFEPWFATLWALNRVLWGITRPTEAARAPRRRRRRVAPPINAPDVSILPSG